MSVQLINQLFENHFNINGNRNERTLGMAANCNVSSNGNNSISDGKEIRQEKQGLKKYKAVFIHYSGEEDNGMDSEEIEAADYNSAWKLAITYPGRLYKLTEL